MIRENITAVLRGGKSEGLATESIWVELRNKKGEITLIGLYYRPPNSQREIEEEICEITESSKINRVVMGILTFPTLTGTAIV